MYAFFPSTFIEKLKLSPAAVVVAGREIFDTSGGETSVGFGFSTVTEKLLSDGWGTGPVTGDPELVSIPLAERLRTTDRVNEEVVFLGFGSPGSGLLKSIPAYPAISSREIL